jgi:predicted flap endonuclease-1-like 5' DNA nuclease
MMTVIEANLIPIIVALLIGIATALWMFRGRRAASLTTTEPARLDGLPPAPPLDQQRRVRDGVDTREGHGLADHGAAATKDVAGQIFGVDAHPDMAAPSGPADNLQVLKGVGPKLALRLNENGIFRFDQLASLSQNEAAMLDQRMGPFKGRIARDRVIEQASYLARGDRDGFEANFGKLGSSS